MQPGASGYDIHAHCVRMATSDTALARTLHKLLDTAIRRRAAHHCARRDRGGDLALWERLRNSGQIGAGYWAILSHTHVPPT